MLGVFPMLMMFLITSITTLRERSSGTLERLMISPLRKFELILGYTKAFLLVSLIQSTFISTYTIWILRLKIAGSALSLILVSLLSSAIGLAIGLSISSFANNEFQAIQFMPAILLPQLLLSGALIPRSSMPRVLDDLSNFLPLSYSMDALKKVLIGQGSIVGDSFIILGIVALILTLGSLLLTGQSR